MVNLEAATFVMTQAIVSRQPVADLEFLSCITLNKYPEDIKKSWRKYEYFPIYSWNFSDAII